MQSEQLFACTVGCHIQHGLKTAGSSNHPHHHPPNRALSVGFPIGSILVELRLLTLTLYNGAFKEPEDL